MLCVLRQHRYSARLVYRTMTTTTPKTIKEGSVTMTFPADQDSAVFYNPVQVQNRDLSILIISIWSNICRKTKADTDNNGLVILDALAASGLRSLRYWNELDNVKHVTINDLSLDAVERARENVTNNNLQDKLLKDNINRDYGICVQQGDATMEMYTSRSVRRQQQQTEIESTSISLQDQILNKSTYDVIDLDPYGSAAPFLDAAIQALHPKSSLLCLTCTDMAALGGSHPETCFGRYGSMPLPRVGYLQELAIRILLGHVATVASKYGRTIRPVLSVGMDFYVRVFVQVVTDKASVMNLSLNMGHVYQSTQCPSFTIVPIGQVGGKNNKTYQPGRLQVDQLDDGPYKIGGPFWLGPMHNRDVIDGAIEHLQSTTNTSTKPDVKLLATASRLLGLLYNCRDEVVEAPLYYCLPDLAATLNASTPPMREFCAALVNAGYKVSNYHKEPNAIKTTAPNKVVWDVMRACVEKSSMNKKRSDVATKILSATPSIEKVDFTIPESILEAERVRRESKISRFPHNPEKNWGPKKAAPKRQRVAENGSSSSNKASKTQE